ncbi:MAG: hypothetical protein ACFCVD_12255 [Nodosilinea sp.]
MLRKIVIGLLCTLVSLTLIISPAQAKPFSLPWFENTDLTIEQQGFISELASKYVPAIEEVLFPEQREKFETAIQEGYSLRKAFKSMALTSEQKNELAAAMKALPKGKLFATLTPEQKKEVFMNKKELFAPTAEEITEKIKAGMKAKETYAPDAPGSEFAPSIEEIGERIKMGMEKKKEFMPSLEEIQEKISEKLESLTE